MILYIFRSGNQGESGEDYNIFKKIGRFFGNGMWGKGISICNLHKKMTGFYDETWRYFREKACGIGKKVV